jgi:FkbM family methyltransferase
MEIKMSSLIDLYFETRHSDIHNSSWLWPKNDIGCWKHLNKKKYANTPHEITKFCDTKNLVIQAGGNCGMYPKQYANLFQSVITFEPLWENFFCLTYNLPEKNIYKFQAALGNNNIPIGLDIPLDSNNEINVGNVKTVTGIGQIPQLTIDSLNLSPDLIHLDIEGFEPFALMGAEHTINRSRPVIALEINESLAKYNWSVNDLTNLLEKFEYKCVSQINSLDSVWKHQP